MNSNRDAHLRQIQELTLPLSRLKGVGPKRAIFLAEKGLHTILDLLFFTPIRYEDRTKISSIECTKEGLPALVKGRVVSGREERFTPSRKKRFKIVVRDNGGRLELFWFHYRKPLLNRFSAPDLELLIYGHIQINRGQKQMIHPDVSVLEPHGSNSEIHRLGFYPVYSTVKGISPGILRSLVKRALENYLDSLTDPVPGPVIQRLGLPGLPNAIESVHFPSQGLSVDELNLFSTSSHKRLLFDRFFMVMLAIASMKKLREKRPGPRFLVPSNLMEDLENLFPFKWTSHQIRAFEDMIKDFSRPRPMNRLLLGDVGCGKTAVAAVAAYISIWNKAQAAIMVPTQVLANQHCEYFSSLPDQMGFRPVLLRGGLRKGERQDIYDKIREGRYNLIIGTQSLIQGELSFANLGLVVIDEQHRFGVRERALVSQKGANPHLLVMTATPIPRTLAMTVYGDMDVSVIREYPKGRRPVLTQLVEEGQKRTVLETVISRMSAGEQAFVICPVIVGSEENDLKNAIEMAERLKKILMPRFRIGLIHGRLSPEEREEVMDNFCKGSIDLLVGTTVIEVGVHVPKATVMIIEHPERFGLAQLHQLRGRVGRGPQRGLCLLMLPSSLSEKSLSRLRVLVESADGFEIAQKDLELRGHGELVGTKQTGIGELDFSEMVRESELLLKAREEAERLIASDPELELPENRLLKGLITSLSLESVDL